MRNRLLSLTRNSIPYIKELRPIAGSVTAVILWQQLDYWFEKYPDGFFKFMSPPENEHTSYKAGDSWSEELGFSEKEFRNAFDKIGLRYSSKTLFNKTERKFFKGEKEYFFVSYQDKLKKMTFYYRNHEKADNALDELVKIPPKKRKSSPAENSKTESIVDDQRAATVDDQREATHLPKGHLPTLPKGSYPPAQREAGVTEITSEITSETTAAESNLSNEELNCFEWAKKETYWSKLVYSEKAFLKHYRSESQALKGQYQNWLEIQQAEAQKNAPKKAAPTKPIWQLQGFNSEQEYNAAHLRKLKQMEMDAKGGKAVNG